jgi:hypothetical protein
MSFTHPSLPRILWRQSENESNARSSLRDPFVGHRCPAREAITAQDIWTRETSVLVNDTNDPNHWKRRREFNATLKTARERVEKLFNEGKSEPDVIAARPLKDLDAKWAASDDAAVAFIKMVYNSFKRSVTAEPRRPAPAQRST